MNNLEVKDINFVWNEEYPIFSSEKFLRSISSEYGWVGGFADNDLKLVLPYIIKKNLIFRCLQFQTDTIVIDGELTENDEKFFLNRVIAELGNKADFVIQPPANVVFRTYPDCSISAKFGSYVIDLGLTEEELWAGIHQKHRNVIRNAIKNNVKIEIGAKNLDIAYNLIKNTLERSNKSFLNRNKFDKLIESLGDNVEICMAYHNGEPQGCAVIPFSKYCAYYSYGGSISNPLLGSINLLHWEAIKYFKYLDVKKYDFVGARIKPEPDSKLEGIQRFKSRFGPTMKQGFLWKVIINRKKYWLYNVLYKIKNSEGDIIDQEKDK